MARFRSDQFRIQFSIEGVALDHTSWDTFDGGDIEPQSQNFNPGGMAPAVAMGGLRKRAPITITRNWDSTLRSAYLAIDRAGGVSSCKVVVTDLNKDRSGAGTITYTGVVGKVTPPKRESTSSAPAMLSVEIDCNEDLG